MVRIWISRMGNACLSSWDVNEAFVFGWDLLIYLLRRNEESLHSHTASLSKLSSHTVWTDGLQNGDDVLPAIAPGYSTVSNFRY